MSFFTEFKNFKLTEFDGFDNVINLSGELDICQAATVCKYSDFGIVPDSGIMHLLGVLGKNAIGIFNNKEPENINPEYRVSQYSNIIPYNKNELSFSKINKHYSKQKFITKKQEKYEDITFVFAGDTHINETVNIINFYKKNGIKNIKFFTSKSINIKEVVKIPPLTSRYDYSKFILRDLYKYIDTEFVLISQWDGFILDFECWDDNFLL